MLSFLTSYVAPLENLIPVMSRTNPFGFCRCFRINVDEKVSADVLDRMLSKGSMQVFLRYHKKFGGCERVSLPDGQGLQQEVPNRLLLARNLQIHNVGHV